MFRKMMVVLMAAMAIAIHSDAADKTPNIILILVDDQGYYDLGSYGATEFGRSPDNGVRGGIAYGRDHNAKAMTMWFAGGGVNAGHTIGATDEIGAEAVECVHSIHDVHVTLLKLLGLDDNKLTYFHAGRYKQLSQFGGTVNDELLI